jgi:hypothetical protein
MPVTVIPVLKCLPAIFFHYPISKDIANLMMAGHCISNDYFVHTGYHVIGNAIPLGETAGKFAIRAVPDHKKPKDLLSQ